MKAPVAIDVENNRGEEFVTEADWIPGFWNFLLALDRHDLIAELVQNDLDQQATQTVISFEEDRLLCEGNGRPVEPDGWRRLRKIQGAGESVPAKRGKIGVKNHGLKTAFTIGDEIQVLSDGRSIVQTLYARGKEKPPYPGASAKPSLNSEAPKYGCRIVISYRNKNLEPREGEAIVLGATGTAEVDALFKTACENIPEQFAGIVSPEVAPRYEIVLRHWRFGEARFAFSCTHPRKVARNIEVFHRKCEVGGNAASARSTLREEAARRALPLAGRLEERVPNFFRRQHRALVEVSWPIDARGKPRTGTGRFRYPIGYPESSHEARTGHGAFFNAPIVSDTGRHGPAPNDQTNKELRRACESLLVDVIARRLVPIWDADGLAPLVPSPGSSNPDEAVRPLLTALAELNAIPTIKWRAATRLLLKGRKSNGSGNAQRIAGRAKHGEPQRYRFVAPVATWNNTAIHASLAVICPIQEQQLDPRIHSDIIHLLADGHTVGFSKHFITFDEDDALGRAIGKGNQYFTADENVKREISQLVIAQAFLDLTKEALDREKWKPQTEDVLQAALLLPDTQAEATPFHELHVSAPLPVDVPGLRFPPILHKGIASHPLFRRKKWRRPRYTMAKFLESGSLQDADEETRNLFWGWLRQNNSRVRPQERAILRNIAIWPDTGGRLAKLSDLCEPLSRRVGIVLGQSIRQPREDVRGSGIAALGRKRRTSFRRVPSQDELRGWLERWMAKFAVGDIANAEKAAALDHFESDLTALLKSQGTARVLRAMNVALPALAQDGSIRLRAELVAPKNSIERLGLRRRFLLKDRRRARALDMLSAALSEPTIGMLVAAFEEDSGNFGALQARLQQFLTLTDTSDVSRVQLARMAILPVHGIACAPRDLAFIGPKGDYWGTWKIRIAGKSLSQDDQRRYLAVGVTSASPTDESSRAFLQWLSEQDPEILERHISCVLRHILDRNGPASWAEVFTDIPFIPTKHQKGFQLVSLRTAQRRPVYLPDLREIAEQVVEKDPRIHLVIDRVQEVAQPISEPLRRLGVKSLREAIGEPAHVAGTGSIEEATERLMDKLNALRSPKFRRTFLKRLDELGVEPMLVRHDWHDRLSRIGAIRFADDVEAQYRLHGKPYRVAANAGFDLVSGTFWVRKELQGGLSSLYEGIAGQLVFKSTARPVHLLALERALDLEIRDPSFGHPSSSEAEWQQEEAIGSEGAQDGVGDAVDPGEAVFGHAPFRPDPSRNLPKPGQIPSNSNAKPARREGRTHPGGANKAGGSDSYTPEMEKEHVESLKRQHYASHCQMCLCESLPKDLAPMGSYVEWEEVRRRVVEAHHVDPKSGGGARHAGNLVLLCKLHHDNYGRRLTREAVTAALREKANKKVISFAENDGGTSEVIGRVIEIVIPDTGEVVSIFFTNEHAGYWLSNAYPTSDDASLK